MTVTKETLCQMFNLCWKPILHGMFSSMLAISYIVNIIPTLASMAFHFMVVLIKNSCNGFIPYWKVPLWTPGTSNSTCIVLSHLWILVHHWMNVQDLVPVQHFLIWTWILFNRNNQSKYTASVIGMLLTYTDNNDHLKLKVKNVRKRGNWRAIWFFKNWLWTNCLLSSSLILSFCD